MENKAQNNFAKWLLDNCDSYSFVADTSTGLYHSVNCTELSKISMENARGCGKNPEKSGYFACKKCLPHRASAYALKTKARQPAKKIKTKAEIMKEQLTVICESYGLHVEFTGSCAFVTTIVGEWYFDICQRPIKIHHSNLEQRTHNNSSPISYSHIQKKTFVSPAHAIAYIFHHEQATIIRLMSPESNNCTNQLMPDDVRGGLELSNKPKAPESSTNDSAIADMAYRESVYKQAEIYQKYVEQEDRDIEIAVANMQRYLKPEQQREKKK